MEYLSEMGRNATESDFRTCKMAAGSHFVKRNSPKIKIVLSLAVNDSSIYFRGTGDIRCYVRP